MKTAPVPYLQRARLNLAALCLLWPLMSTALPLVPVQAQDQPATPPAVWMMELAEPPAALVYAAQGGGLAAAQANEQAAQAAQAQIAAIRAGQEGLAEPLAALDVTQLFAVQRVYNGIAVLADAGQAAALSQLPGVLALHLLTPKQPHNDQSIPYLGVPSLWAGAGIGGALRGEGIRVAVIDTGIDYLHRDFAGPGEGYAKNDPALAGDIAGFPGPRIVGGYDFVGDDYNGNDQLIPQPDPDPMDCYGHGTHVAGTLAGSGVTAGGETFAGPYDTHVNFPALAIGPGVAPHADIYALKVFGCSGSTNFVDLALEWAVDPDGDGNFADRMDVINLSLGAPYGESYDTSVIAAGNAALAGVIVVASAGNSGDTQLIAGSPSTADRVLSVAASGHTSDYLNSFSSRGPRLGDAALKPDVSAPGDSIYSAGSGTGRNGRTASGTSMAAPHVAGVMALLRQAHPDWSVEELKALAINTARPFPEPLPLVRGGAGRIDPPAAIASAAVAYLAGGSGRVSMSFGAPAVTGMYTATQQLVVANKGGADLAVAVTYQSLASLPGVRVLTPPEPLRVPAHVSVQTPITLVVDAAQLRQVTAPGDVYNDWRHFFAEESGYLTLVISTDAPAAEQIAGAVHPTLRVPLYVAPRPASSMGAAIASLDFNRGLTKTIELVGSSVSGSRPPTDVVSLASVLELKMQSPNTRPPDLAPNLGDNFDFADLKDVGVTARTVQTPTAGLDSVESADVYFGLTTWASWSTPSEVTFKILIDTDLDGVDDYLLYNIDPAIHLVPQTVYSTELYNLHTDFGRLQGLLNVIGPDRYDSGLFFRSALLLHAAAAELGLSTRHSSFAFRIETTTNDAAGNTLVVDRTPSLYYDVARPALRFTLPAAVADGAPMVRDEPQTEIGVQLDPMGQTLRPAAGVLILHHHNAPAEPSSVVAIHYVSAYEWAAHVYLPLAAR